MAEWKKLIVSGARAELADASGSFSGSFQGDGSSLTGVTATTLDIDGFGSDLSGITVAGSDQIILSDGGTEGRVNISQLGTYIFSTASDAGDASYGADGAITINTDSVEGTMLNTNVADTTTIELSSDTLSVLKVPQVLSFGAGLVDPGDFDGSTARTPSVDSGSMTAFFSQDTFASASGDVTFNAAGVATIQANSVALGTDTTGNYVETVSAGSGIVTIAEADAEGATKTINVDSGSMLPFYSSSIFSTISGDVTINSAGVATVTSASVEGVLTAGDGLSGTDYNGASNQTFALDLNELTAAAVDPTADSIAIIDANDGNASRKESITDFVTAIAGTNLQVSASTLTAAVPDFMSNGSDNRVLTATGADAMNAEANLTFDGSTLTVSGDATITGNLNVTGDTIQAQVTNLNVEDKFILLNSGSSTATDESGIIFGGSNGTANNGAALIWNGDYNSNDGRLAIANSVNGDATTAAVSYHVAGVYEGNESAAATAQADHVGNIRVDAADDIFIYV